MIIKKEFQNYFTLIINLNHIKMKTNEEIANRIIEMLHEEFYPETITPGSNLSNDLGLDSLETFDFASSLENEFGIRFEEKEIIGLKGQSVEQIAQIIYERQ